LEVPPRVAILVDPIDYVEGAREVVDSLGDHVRVRGGCKEVVADEKVQVVRSVRVRKPLEEESSGGAGFGCGVKAAGCREWAALIAAPVL